AKWIDTAIAAGANNVNNVVFTLSDKKLEETKNLLIKEAISNARSKANVAASTLGLKVVGVKSASVNEFETSPPQPLLAAQPYATDGAAKTATPIISGQEQVSTNVNIVYFLG
ncbi:MAG TPA: SIMPL domain-containing protein, partial [Candidatus Bathyarchaeia archaeon]|nr:SIMPL domain-containing protein [Candidatus Bathyarchaeia archaeon]